MKRWKIYYLGGRYVCRGTGLNVSAAGSSAEIAFVKWLLYWGNREQWLEFEKLLNKYHGDLWTHSRHP